MDPSSRERASVNPAWHDDLENASTVDQTVAFVRRYLGNLSAQDMERLPRYCHPSRIKGDEDIDDLTFKLSRAQRERSRAGDIELLEEVFAFVLHASLRISRLNRVRVRGVAQFGWGRAVRQMS
jgi:hypothetical protein